MKSPGARRGRGSSESVEAAKSPSGPSAVAPIHTGTRVPIHTGTRVEWERSPSVSDGLVRSESGVVRSDHTGKPDYTLIDLKMVERWAIHMTKHVEDKGRNNWRKASSEDDYERFRQGAWRHFVAWLRGEDDEDHVAALLFNLSGAEHVRGKLGGK